MLSSVGLDIVSGQPRLIFGDLTGFYHGINFLVLAIGIYGIGEMLWTIEQSKGDMMLSKATVSVRRTLAALKELLGEGPLVGGYQARVRPENLLGESRSRTRKSDQEDRR